MGWTSEIYLNKKKYQKMLEKIKNFKPGKLSVKQGDFEKVLKKHKNDFLYCDPPYYIGSDSKMFKGVYPMRNIPVHHKDFPHEKLRDMLKKHKGGFILSYNDCPTIRKYYKGFKKSSQLGNIPLELEKYTMGQGETRIGKNRMMTI